MAETNESVVYFCPTCGAASLDFSELGGEARCRVCGWKGGLHERVAHAFRHDFLSGESAILEVVNDIRAIVAASSKLYVTFLLKWGFLRQGNDLKYQIARYLSVAARSVLTSFIQEREQLEKERVQEGQHAS